MEGRELAKTISKAIFLASIQSSIGAVEMSSKFSVLNFSKDQETLQRAADALRSYMIIAVVWTLGTVLSLYASHGWCGGWVGFAANVVMMAWIYFSYTTAFATAAKEHGLKYPVIFSPEYKKYMAIAGVALLVGIGYLGGYFEPENDRKRK